MASGAKNKPEHVSLGELDTLPLDDLRVLVRDLVDHLGLCVYAWRHDEDGPAFCYEFKPRPSEEP